MARECKKSSNESQREEAGENDIILPSYTCFLLITGYIFSCSTILYSCIINGREGQEVKKNELGPVFMGRRVVPALL